MENDELSNYYFKMVNHFYENNEIRLRAVAKVKDIANEPAYVKSLDSREELLAKCSGIE